MIAEFKICIIRYSYVVVIIKTRNLKCLKYIAEMEQFKNISKIFSSELPRTSMKDGPKLEDLECVEDDVR